MQNSKLFQLLNTFSSHEIHRFQLYLQSPYHNANPLFFQLFEAIRPFLHSRNIQPISNEIVFRKLSAVAKSKSTKKFNSLQFNSWCASLYKLAASFVSLNQMELKSNAIELNYLQILNKRKLTDLFEYHAEKTKQQIDIHPEFESSYYDYFLLQKYINEFEEILQSRTKPRNIPSVLTSLDNFYSHQKLKYWSAALHYKKMFDQPIEILWEDFLLQYFTTNQMADEQIEINRQILLLEKSTDTMPHYKWLKAKLVNLKTKLVVAARKEIYLFLVNYCIAQINLGKHDYYKEIFEIYQLGLQQELVIQNKRISPWDFKNIITVALQQKQLIWAEKFIKTYSKILPKDEMDNAYNYNLSRVFFIEKKYTESLKLSQMVAYTDIFYQLDSKLMQAKILFELQEFDTLDDLIISLNKLLNRKRKLSAHYQKRYKNFVFYLQKLLKTSNEKNAKLVLKKLNADDEVPDKNWLIEKFELI